ncbi:MAG: hypothetical protein RL653_22 [Pseudomonadota bacterium]
MFLCLLIALGASWLLWLALKGRTAWDALEAMPVTPLSEAADGAVVRVCGRAVLAGAPLRTPVQGRPCVGYRLELTGTKQPRATGDWAAFEVQDAGVKARVDSGQLEPLLARTYEGRLAPGVPLPAAAAALAGPGDAPTGWRESWVEADEPVTVKGQLVHSSEGPRLAAPEGEPLRLSTLERLTRRR